MIHCCGGGMRKRNPDRPIIMPYRIIYRYGAEVRNSFKYHSQLVGSPQHRNWLLIIHHRSRRNFIDRNRAKGCCCHTRLHLRNWNWHLQIFWLFNWNGFGLDAVAGKPLKLGRRVISAAMSWIVCPAADDDRGWLDWKTRTVMLILWLIAI